MLPWSLLSGSPGERGLHAFRMLRTNVMFYFEEGGRIKIAYTVCKDRMKLKDGEVERREVLTLTDIS